MATTMAMIRTLTHVHPTQHATNVPHPHPIAIGAVTITHAMPLDHSMVASMVKIVTR